MRRGVEFCDIYSGLVLDEAFVVDHFLPWSFVAHDLAWNLVPVSPESNIRKSDSLPELDVYLPRLAKLHLFALKNVIISARIFEDYTRCFGREPKELLKLSEGNIVLEFRRIIAPQTQIAANQGFKTGWRYHDKV